MNLKSVNLVLPGLFKSFQESEIDAGHFTQPNLIQKFISQSNRLSVKNKQTKQFSVHYLESYPLAFYESTGGVKSENAVLYAEPISIEVKSDHIVAFPVSIDTIDRDKVENIIKHFNQHFAPDGLFLKYLPSGRFACYSSNNVIPEMSAVYSIYGRDIKHFLPQGEDARFWLRVFNEVQMFFHEYINEEDRIFNNQLLNGFWFWGAGNNIDNEVVNTSFIGAPGWLKGFCKFNNFNYCELSDIKKSNNQDFYIIDESLLLSSSCGNLKTWLEELKKIESELLLPLHKLLKAGVINEINIHESPESSYQLKNMHKYRFYRKNISLNDICVINS